MILAEKILKEELEKNKKFPNPVTLKYARPAIEIAIKEAMWLTYCFAQGIDPSTTRYTQTFLDFYNKEVQ